ncbi:MAG: penicillin-binding protein [Roseburia sp.]|nr:penicillin-binding protein [Roseburia sp.]
MKKSAKITWIIFSVILGIVASAVGIFFILIEPNINVIETPDLDLTQLTSYSRTVVFLDADGNPIDDAMYDGNKFYVRLDDLPSHTVDAFIAIEDKRFFDHGGIDYKRMASALVSNIKSRSFREGASTITQQLIKNTHLSNEKTIKRKLVEMRMARKLERIYDKNQILESYFNILYFGSGIRGLGTASRVMFDKSASELTLAQSAALASVINNPSKYSPYNNYDNLTKRKELVLKQMLEQSRITRDEYDTAVAEEIVFGKNKQNQYVSAALKSACSALGCTEKELFINNYTLKTSYKPEIAAKARELIGDVDTDFARILVLDNASGGIVCDETNNTGYINPRRSPASAIKPFLSYAPALENDMNPLSQIDDSPTNFGDYAPGNYKGIYRGYQSLEDCLVYSSNVAAVSLLKQNGVEYSKRIASAFGLPFDDSDDSLTVALGGMKYGVTLIELANAYRTLANGGMYSDVRYINSVYDGNYSKYIAKNEYTRAVGDDTAYLITDMLQACAKRGTAKKLKYSGIIAAKTGTNGDENGNYDCYCIAYTPQYTIAVWFGADGTPIPNDMTGAACGNIIKKLCDGETIKTDTEFEMPDSVAYYDVDMNELDDTHSVYLADPLLPKRYRRRTLLSKKHLPIRKSVDIFDFYDRYFMWEDIYDTESE